MNSEYFARMRASLTRGLRSLKLTLISLFLLAGSSVIGTILPQGLPLSEYERRLGPLGARIIGILQLSDMYHAWWFLGLLGLFALNLAACSLHRLPGVWRQVLHPDPAPGERWLQGRPCHCRWRDARAPEALLPEFSNIFTQRLGKVRHGEVRGVVWLFVQKQGWSRFGAYITHGAILVILLGGMMGSLGGFRGYVTIAEGQIADRFYLDDGRQSRPLGFGVRCDRFAIERYENSDRPREYRSLLTILENGRAVPGLTQVPVRVNHPLRYRGLNFYQSGYGLDGYLLHLSVSPRAGGGRFEIEVPSGQKVGLPDGTSVTIAGYVTDFDGQGPAAGLELHYPDGGHGRAMAFQSEHLRAGDGDVPYDFRILSVAQRWYTGLQVNRDPGVMLVWVGCLLLVAGTLAAFYFSHQRWWLQLRQDQNGTLVVFSAQSHRHTESFARRFDALCRELQSGSSPERS